MGRDACFCQDVEKVVDLLLFLWCWNRSRMSVRVMLLSSACSDMASLVSVTGCRGSDYTLQVIVKEFVLIESVHVVMFDV